MLKRPIAIYYEHPRWFERVFAEMDRRHTPYAKVDAARHHYDIALNGDHNYSLLFNRMSPRRPVDETIPADYLEAR